VVLAGPSGGRFVSSGPLGPADPIDPHELLSGQPLALPCDPVLVPGVVDAEGGE
jgi:hypothetical protein